MSTSALAKLCFKGMKRFVYPPFRTNRMSTELEDPPDPRTEPDYKLDLNGVALTSEETQRVKDFMDDASVHQMVLLPNFHARLHAHAPPTGYVAVFHQDTFFNSRIVDRTLFRGVAACAIVKDEYIDRHVLQQLKHQLNALLPDVSPLPALQTRPHNWVASLGSFGWVSICEKKDMSCIQYQVFVVAGLDDASYEAMFLAMRAMHRHDTMKQAVEKLQFWRQIAQQNRTRILAVVKQLLQEPTRSSTEEAFEKRTTLVLDQEKTAAATQWLSKEGGISIPIWYSVPSRTPAFCDPIPEGLEGYPLGAALQRVGERFPHIVDTEWDVFLDDVVHSHNSYIVRQAGCSSVRGPAVVFVRGPTDPILVYPRGTKEIRLEKTFDVMGTQAKYTVHEILPEFVRGLVVCWEDDEKDNRILRCQFADHRNGELNGEVVEKWIPVFVRVSLADDFGVVKQKTEGRLRGLCASEYAYIRRDGVHN